VIKKEAFTLFEMLIVVIIISILYIVGISTISFQKREKRVDIFKMKEFLIQKYGFEIELICINDCKKCYIKDKNKMEKIEKNFDFKENLSIYLIDKNYLSYKESFNNFDDKEVCIRYKISKKGISEPMIVKNGELFFTLPSFVGEVKSFVSMSEAKEWYIKSEYDLEEIY